MELRDYQLEAVNRLKNGSILCGGVGSGKSRVSLAYYFIKIAKGQIQINDDGEYREPQDPVKLVIITPAKKRDDKEWELELSHFNLSVEKDGIIIDSWNNLKKYTEIFGAFFIFDEQHVTGRGAWSKSFLKICRKNRWILLSATPGDKWEDYMTVFIANGFCRNRTEFESKYCVFSPYVKYKKIQKYLREQELEKMRDEILIIMKDNRTTIRHHEYCIAEYDREAYRRVWRDRWDIYENEPIQEVSKLMALIRKVSNSDKSRLRILDSVFKRFNRLIIFYNFDYELEALRNYMNQNKILFGEWNGHKHERIPNSNRWAYLVQYSSGGEAWNCIRTNCIVFFSQTYSYRQQEQACGRIDRMNTTYTDLYYIHIRSQSQIDRAIYSALGNKKEFNERAFISKNLLTSK